MAAAALPNAHVLVTNRPSVQAQIAQGNMKLSLFVLHNDMVDLLMYSRPITIAIPRHSQKIHASDYLI
jgi:hypothetical protein